MTQYIILRQVTPSPSSDEIGTSTMFQIVGRREATGTKKAVRDYIGESRADLGENETFVAVALSAFSPIAVSIEQPPPQLRFDQETRSRPKQPATTAAGGGTPPLAE